MPTTTASSAPTPIHPTGSSDYEVIVVGARVAGAATAMLLARQGLRVLLVDRAPAPGTDTLSTHALMRAGVYQLERWGVLDGVRRAGTPAVRKTTFHYGDEVQAVEIKPKAGVDALYGPRRTVLDPLLVQAAESAGAEVRFGVSVRDLLWRQGRVAGIEAESRQHGTFRAFAPWVVGADGVRSLVARQAGAEVTWQGTASGAFLYAYWPLADDGYRWFYRPGATAGVIPTNDGLSCVWAGTPTDRFLHRLQGDVAGAYRQLLIEAAPELAPELRQSEQAGRVRGFPGIPGFLRRPWGPGWALVGDASSFRDPISAHGITDALRDAEFLARALAEACAGASSAASGAEALTLYEQQRDAASLRVAEITDEIAAYRWDLPEVKELLVAMARAMNPELDMLQALSDQQSGELSAAA